MLKEIILRHNRCSLALIFHLSPSAILFFRIKEAQYTVNTKVLGFSVLAQTVLPLFSVLCIGTYRSNSESKAEYSWLPFNSYP